MDAYGHNLLGFGQYGRYGHYRYLEDFKAWYSESLLMDAYGHNLSGYGRLWTQFIRVWTL